MTTPRTPCRAVPGHAARKESACCLGEHQRRRQPDPLGGRVVDDEAGLERGGGDLGRERLGQVEADQQPGAAHLGDAVVGGEPVAQVVAQRR